jgi:membrane associated rhomboid family serine protease
MAYDDRDYFRPRPRVDFGGPFGPAGKGLLIAFAAAYLSALILADTVNFAMPDFWNAVSEGESGPSLARMLFVLTPQDTSPWLEGFTAGFWKLLTHWVVPANVISAALYCLFIYLIARRTESVFGTRRFLTMFVACCVTAGLLASLVDPLIAWRAEHVVIMGPAPGIMMLFATLIWLAPQQRSIFGWPLRNVVIGVLAFVVLFGLVRPLFTGDSVVLSPTHVLWGPLFAWGWMRVLQARGRIPHLEAPSAAEPWASPDYAKEDTGPTKAELKRQQKAAQERQAVQAEKERLDNILDKVGKEGLASLTRAERKFLDSQSAKQKNRHKERQP